MITSWALDIIDGVADDRPQHASRHVPGALGRTGCAGIRCHLGKQPLRHRTLHPRGEDGWQHRTSDRRHDRVRPDAAAHRHLTVTDARIERILFRARWPLKRLGAPRPIGKTIAVAGCHSACNIGSDSHRMIFLPSLRFSKGGISAMRAGIRISSLVPSGLVIESVSDSSDSIILAVRSEGGMGRVPIVRGANEPSRDHAEAYLLACTWQICIADTIDKSQRYSAAGC